METLPTPVSFRAFVGPTPAGKISALVSLAFILIVGLALRIRDTEQPTEQEA